MGRVLLTMLVRIGEWVEGQNVEVCKVADIAGYNSEVMHPRSGCNERILKEIRRFAYHDARCFAAHISIRRHDGHRRSQAGYPMVKSLRHRLILTSGSLCALLQFE